jgi:hypothetical protein
MCKRNVRSPSKITYPRLHAVDEFYFGHGLESVQPEGDLDSLCALVVGGGSIKTAPVC